MPTRLVAPFLLIFTLISLYSCSTPATQNANTMIDLHIEQFFSGKLTAEGLDKDRSGKVTRTFKADITATWQGDTGTLDEHFIFDNGEKQQRVWTLKKVANNQYSASANDVKGNNELNVIGNRLLMKYPLEINYKDKPLTLAVDDRMYLVNENTILNESTLKKFGLKVGSILLVIKKIP